MLADVFTASKGTGLGVACAAEALRDSPTTLNLRGRSSDLHAGNGRVAELGLEQPDDREPAQHGNGHG